MANEEHLAVLRSGVGRWRAWRRTTDVWPDLNGAALAGVDLTGADLTGADLTGATLIDAELVEADLTNAFLARADLSGANLTGANLTRANLTGASLVRADLTSARLASASLAGANLASARLVQARLTRTRLSDANLTDANLARANLTGADLTRATLAGANLTGAALVETNLEGSTLDGCHVYGTSVWDVRVHGASQRGLHITGPGKSAITVDDLEVAQFVYLLLNNSKLRSVIDAVTSKAVLLLGRFTPERKEVLDGLHGEIRRRGYLPILFDFDRPSSRDTTETVLTLAGMARFVIADLTDAASVQQELVTIATALPSVPVQPIVLRGEREWSMFRDLQRRGAILTPYVYDSPDALLAALPERVIGPADEEAQARRAQIAQLYAEADARRAAQ